MNKISKCSSICASLLIGKNNIIGKNVKIFENVTIGNNNKIYDNTIIYPNTKIGNNNIFLHRNKIGEIGIQSSFDSDNFEFKYNGLEIGNNNFFHVDNIVFNGYDKKTKIGNYNKILGENHIGHDCVITNYVNIYPRTLLCGFVTMLPYSGTGVGTYIKQNIVIGHYSFTGLNSTTTKNIFPFYISIDNNYLRLNDKRLNNIKSIYDFEKIILKIRDNKINYKKENLPIELNKIINNYYSITNPPSICNTEPFT